ncbi:MAG: CDP-alcohol phosphatidyltransferase family protein [Oscillospiraceae bacterium]|nr:CDP-alcohol phosphatidyltransferase family protein [Oscillospiraceae bacterium]
MKLKHLPNAITISRMLIVISLIFIPPLTPLSIALFLIAGITDMIDGALARRIKDAHSNLGAELDSIADMLMVIVTVFFIMPAMDLWGWLWFAILGALTFKLMSAIPGLIKHRKVFFLHTISNKILAMILFIGAILYFIFGGHTGVNAYIVFLLAAVFVITLEEMVIISMLDYPNKDIKGFWHVKRVNEAYRKSQSSAI